METSHLGIHHLYTLYLSYIRIRLSVEEIQDDKPLNSEFKQGHEWEPKLGYDVLSLQNMGLPNRGDPYGNGVFIISNVAVVMTAAQADDNMYRWITCTTERVTQYVFMEKNILPAYNRGGRWAENKAYKALCKQMEKHRRHQDWNTVKELNKQRQSMPSKDTNDPAFRRLYYIRYADDCAPRRRVQVA